MWALPNIAKLNARAETPDAQAEIKRLVANPEEVTCESCEEPSYVAEEYYDIFSDVPKGVVGSCEEHDSGGPEGYFRCETDGKLYIENYTWERYESGGDCLNCVRKRVLADPDEWTSTAKASREAVTFDDIRQAKHLLAVGQEVPDNLIFLGNAEFDSMSGEGIYGSDGTGKIRELLAMAARLKAKRAILILDAGYQFAVSVGVYIEKVTV